MEIETPSTQPYTLPNKNGNLKLFQQGTTLLQQVRQMNQSQNFSGNLPNLGIANNLSLGPMNAPNFYGHANRLNKNHNQVYNHQQHLNGFHYNYNKQNYNPQNHNKQNYNTNNYAQQGSNQNYNNQNYMNNFSH